MPTISAFLLSITGSMVARAFVSLGFGFVSYAALSALAASVISAVALNYGGLDLATLAIVNLAGGGASLGVLSSALVVRATLMGIKRLAPL